MDLRQVDREGHKLDGVTADAYDLLLSAARRDGIAAPSLEIVSAYRTEAQQQKIWDDGIKKYGSELAARKWVAPPGGSGHEKGRAIDFNIGGLPMGKIAEMREHPAYKWLVEHAGEYGFVPYKVEPWHWEHKGTLVAAARQVPDWLKVAGGILAGVVAIEVLNG